MAKLVWDETSSADVCRAFVLAWRIMQLIIEENGNNKWLAEGMPHCNMRQDFINTPEGTQPADGVHEIYNQLPCGVIWRMSCLCSVVVVFCSL